MEESPEIRIRAGHGSQALYWLGRIGLRLLGWRVQGPEPVFPRYVAIFAPHTSNWDWPIAMLVSFALHVKGNWFGKASLFRGPLAWLMRATGGVPIERSEHHNFVSMAAGAFASHDRFCLALAPEGTRKKMPGWKSGFYYIALEAQAPIVLAFIDYAEKRAGNGGYLYPSGDVEADLEKIRAFYAQITPRHPEKRSPVVFSKAPTGKRK